MEIYFTLIAMIWCPFEKMNLSRNSSNYTIESRYFLIIYKLFINKIISRKKMVYLTMVLYFTKPIQMKTNFFPWFMCTGVKKKKRKKKSHPHCLTWEIKSCGITTVFFPLTASPHYPDKLEISWKTFTLLPQVFIILFLYIQ